LQSAVAHRIAAEVCEALTNSQQKLQGVQVRYISIMKQAASRSAKEAIPRDHTPVDRWEQSRWSGFGAWQ
jgi:hypothetical protein